MSFPSDFSKLSLEQLKELIAEIGPQPALMREMQVRGLMARIDGLDRPLALSLVTPGGDPAGDKNKDDGAEILMHLFIRNNLTPSQLDELRMFCSAGGAIRFNRAVRSYLNNDWHKAKDDAVLRMMVNGFARREEEANPNAEEGWAQAQQDADEYQEAYKLREYLAEAYGITCAADWHHLLQAMALVKKNHPNHSYTGRKYWNALTKDALRLRDKARAMNASPKDVDAWDQHIWPSIKNGKANKEAVYKRPDGVLYWGDGEQCIIDSKGQPARRAASVFGGVVPENEQPPMYDIGVMVEKAYRENLGR